ncbi:FK506-binding protein 2 [Sporothrix schenckii ATCC 58251]|uniref:peptidylprolyl isomerase n=1 Tax=Sporothrix schenckii (strain ATCC 58251 / de Perez 2211183) TaxID=1391915 RepID=U7PXX7_SPOS1|nr:FK506-binding protein 2 [Sporothrix schenckii ATCC 58251]
MHGLLASLSLMASAAAGVLAADLKIDVTLPVECDRRTQANDKIYVHYRGTLQSNGNKFDASYDRGTPFSFVLGQGQVIKGWEQGLLDMCIGEKRTLTVPPEYGYGQRGIGPIPAGSTLVFETELIGIEGVPKPESIVTKAATGDPSADSSASTEAEAEAETPNVAEKIASKVAEAADVVKTIVADTDDGQEHNEL